MSFIAGIAGPEPSGALYLVTQGEAIIVRFDGDQLIVPDDDAVAALGVEPTDAEYLGRLDDRPIFALAVERAHVIPAPFVARKLRALLLSISDDLFAAASRALQLVAWRRTHRFCGQCGGTTERIAGERALRCARCELTFYPRISPAVIVLVRRGRQALLARGTRFGIPMYSTLAGFSEAGESLEETIHREIREEVGIEVTNLRYFGSQSWPFPNSLMVGFFADYASGELSIDPTEIVDAQWWEPESLPMIPPGRSIARQLIDRWLAEALPTVTTPEPGAS